MPVVGVPPIQYLAKWRMQIAAGLLSSGNNNIARIAEKPVTARGRVQPGVQADGGGGAIRAPAQGIFSPGALARPASIRDRD